MTHLAIGDFVYQRACLQAIKTAFPQLKIDIWIDDCRSKPKPWHEGRNSTLVQWLSGEDYIDKIYPIASDLEHRGKLIDEAQKYQYDLVFYMALHRAKRFASIARKISPKGFVVGNAEPFIHSPLANLLDYPKLNRRYNLNQTSQLPHISDIYQERFRQAFAVQPQQHHNQLTIPIEWQHQANNTLARLTESQGTNNPSTLFVNHLSTSPKRNVDWQDLVKVIAHASKKFSNLFFVINLPPSEFESVTKKLKAEPLLPQARILPYCATEHFYQLPAMIKACDMVLTVETAIMHLAASLNVPQLVLMRKGAQQWQPKQASKILYGDKRVDQISVEQIHQELKNLHFLTNKHHK